MKSDAAQIKPTEEKKLHAQVKDFIAWLKAQKVI